MPNFILASNSSIRKKILNNAGIQYTPVSPQKDEPRADKNENPEDYVLKCAKFKAHEISDQYPDDIVVGCDQIVFFEGQVLNKVDNQKEGIDRLLSFSGKNHKLINGLSIYSRKKEVFSTVTATEMVMHHLTEDIIKSYFEKENPLSSVACYFLEGYGIQLLEEIKGDFFSALGLPLLKITSFLKNFKQ